jgi:hypothetical protein
MMAGQFLVLTGACRFGHGVGGFTTNFNASFGVSTLARKWRLAKMTQMAVLAQMAKMTQKAGFSIISDFWGDLSRSFCIRRTSRAHLGAL